MRTLPVPGILCHLRKACFACVLSLSTLLASANTYYLDAISGNDGYDGLSPSFAWKTLAKINATVFNPGDVILFQRGQTFYGSLRPAANGITYDAYGTGTQPVISGLMPLLSWTDDGSGIYEAGCAQCSAVLNTVVVNNVLQGMGRYPNLTDPNKGYLIYESFNAADAATDIITDNQLTLSTNWTGAEVVVRRNNWVLDRGIIANHSGNSIVFKSSNPYPLNNNFGYFIQNDPRTLDQPGEWYYDAAAHKLKMFFGAAGPGAYNVQVSVVDTLVVLNRDNIVFNNLYFTGANKQAFYVNHSNNAVIKNSSIFNTGMDAILADYPVNGLTVLNNSISYAGNTAINCLYNATSGLTVQGNVVTNIGMIPGMGIDYNGIVANGPGMNISLNTIKNVGYDGIMFSGSPASIKNNFIDGFTLLLDDGGGIYTGANQGRREIVDNIVLNGIGAPEGTPETTASGSVGIYADDDSHNILIQGNTVYNCSRAGVLLHNAANNCVRLNTLYANATQVDMSNDNSMYASLRNDTISNNILFVKDGKQLTLSMRSLNNDFNQAGLIDTNYHASPLDSNGVIKTAWNGNNFNYNLAWWKSAYTGFDQRSHPSPVAIEPYTIHNVTGSNHFANGSFGSNIANAYADFGGSGSYSWSASGLDGGSYMVSASGHVNNYFSISNIEAGKEYRVRFTAQSTTPNTLWMRFIQNGGSYFSFGDAKYFAVGPKRQDYEYVFVSPVTVSGAYMIATVESQAGDMYFDNIDFTEANASITNPADSILFVYNETTAVKNVPLDDLYRDAKNNVYISTVTLQPFTSAVLIRTPLLTLLPIEPQQPTTPGQRNKIALVVYPNPAAGVLHINYTDTNNGNLKMTLYDAGGKMLFNESVGKQQTLLTKEINVSSLQEGIYYLELALPNGNKFVAPFIKQP